ncbi:MULTISPECIES: PhoPQ-activated pathogenicity-related family protein [Pseudomonas syringae group]|uniref:PhoPQ-activated pathogenicity-related family protein n=1 Tax=Pseudomonas syringae group TaxID=136849 RepID=UPI000F02768E|nr:PhoPQ-activated protein PqaA family protein [Pseudomonas viridiflava]MCF9017442.1 PqaA [Pseudomonas syringae]
MIIQILCASALAFLSLLATASPLNATACGIDSKVGFAEALVCYHDAIEHQPLVYRNTGEDIVAGVKRRHYILNSQDWSPEGMVQPSSWLHDVAIFVPDDALPNRALLISTNGTRQTNDGTDPKPSSELPPEAWAMIAKRTRTVVIALSDIPSQYLTYTDDGKPRREDDSVAHSWALFLQNPQQRKTLPLHVPMAAAIARTMSLAEHELAPLGIHRFVLAGASKRGWASWHALIADQRVEAVVPFVIDILDMPKVLEHMYRVYGERWPLAFNAYIKESITQQLDTTQFAKLVKVQDPLSYLNTRYRDRLTVPKYIVNASGDDFFVPDSSHYYYEKLPGTKVIRMVPNSSHYGIVASIEDSLVTFLNRLQRGQMLPVTKSKLSGDGNPSILFSSSERPLQLKLWSANNPKARDFRYACGIRYSATDVTLQPGASIRVPIQTPVTGWSAYFVEAIYSDGFVATSQAYILGKQKYPKQAPPGDNASCQTLP